MKKRKHHFHLRMWIRKAHGLWSGHCHSFLLQLAQNPNSLCSTVPTCCSLITLLLQPRHSSFSSSDIKCVPSPGHFDLLLFLTGVPPFSAQTELTQRGLLWPICLKSSFMHIPLAHSLSNNPVVLPYYPTVLFICYSFVICFPKVECNICESKNLLYLVHHWISWP